MTVDNELDLYKSVLNKIYRMITDAYEYHKYIDGGLYADLNNEFHKIYGVTNDCRK